MVIKKTDHLIGLFYYHLSSDDTVSFLRPRRRRAANTRRPLGVDMRSRKQCLLRRLRSDGWNVLFISRYFYIFPSTIWECKGSIFEFICKIFCKDFSTSLEMTAKVARVWLFFNVNNLFCFKERVSCPTADRPDVYRTFAHFVF